MGREARGNQSAEKAKANGYRKPLLDRSSTPADQHYAVVDVARLPRASARRPAGALVEFSSGPFKGRVYRRTSGGLVRVA